MEGSCAEPGITKFTKPFIADPGCDQGGFEILDLGRVVNSNLLGKGPDRQGRQELRFESVMQLDGAGVDLVIEVVSDEYEPGNSQESLRFGWKRGRLARRTAKSGAARATTRRPPWVRSPEGLEKGCD